jgi:hypothetical protein
MAYQDVAGPLSVKYSVTPADGLRWHVPRDCVATVHRPGGNSGTARPTAGITLVVTMRLGGPPSGGAHRLVLGGNFGDPLRMPADAEPQCSNPTCRSPSGQQPGLDSDSGCRSFGKAQAGLDVRRATSRIAVQYARITPVVALEGTPGLLSGRCGGDFCNGLEATPDRPRRARESHLLWCMTSLRAFLGRRRAGSLLLGATLVRPLGKGITPVVAPGCVPWPFRGRRSGSGALELAPELPRARIRDLRLSWLGCDQRLPREPADSSRRLESFSSAATPRATIRRSQRQRATSPFGRPGVLTSSSGDAIQALVGRSVRLLREVRL